ncbi:MAG TPA: polysaccharide pyruvyl transferase family protein, partial [Candidatus Saccharimonadales bacterium]|nr:polysaccharide pyruvyl transferase family protein [Candidatus Saccharimonadales bacterium]
RILYLPMSYGNFASAIHEKIVFQLIKNDLIIFRDEVSLREFTKHSNKKITSYLIPDLAIFDTYEETIKDKKEYIVLTARLWMDEYKQKNYEKELALFVHYMWERYKLKTFFIPMVWNKNEDDDNRVGKKIQALVANKIIFTIVAPNTPLQVKKILSRAELAVCTRMHSAILSTVVKTPFITIAYEHKTLGFLKHLGLENWNIDIENLSSYLLQEKVDDLFENKYHQFTLKLQEKHQEIMKKEDELIEIVRSFSSVN